MNKKLFERTDVIIIALILLFPLGLFLMWRHQKFNESTRVLITCAILILVGSAYTQATKVSRQVYEQDLSAEQAKYVALQTKVEAAQQELDDSMDEVEVLRVEADEKAKLQIAEAEKQALQLVKEAESKADTIVSKAEDEAASVAQSQLNEAKEEAADLIAQAEQEASALKAAAANEISSYSAAVAPTSQKFQNCTDLRGTYPGGVSSDHAAYQPSMDRDKDGWACE